MTYKNLGIEVLRNSETPLTPGKMWEKAIELGLIQHNDKKQKASLVATLHNDSIKSNGKGVFEVVSKKPTIYRLSETPQLKLTFDNSSKPKITFKGTLSNKEAAIKILKDSETPLTPGQMWVMINERGLIHLKGKNPEGSFRSYLCSDSKKKKGKNTFEMVSKNPITYRLSKNPPKPKSSKKVPKTNNTEQIYEDYWSITLEYSDIHELNFQFTLNEIVDFIDDMKLNNIKYSKSIYLKLQQHLANEFRKSEFSMRKAINQFIKLGFIKQKLESYHPLTKDFLNSKDNINRRINFSAILTSSASFKSSMTKFSDENEISFLLETLKNIGKLSIEDVQAIMCVKTQLYNKGYINREELEIIKIKTIESGFIKRKYNQYSHFMNLLNKMHGVKVKDGYLFISSDYDSDDVDDKDYNNRDTYKQKLYRDKLRELSKSIYGEVLCMLTKEVYQNPIASHILDYKLSDENEQFDWNNGLLVCKDFDDLFNMSLHVTFDDDGYIIFSNGLHEDIINRYSGYKLEDNIFNEKRKEYMCYHRIRFFERHIKGFTIKNGQRYEVKTDL